MKITKKQMVELPQLPRIYLQNKPQKNIQIRKGDQDVLNCK